jgi:hypothetical protein
VLSLLLVVIIIGIVLTAALWFGTLFLQSYFYTEPSRGVFWQAPAAAGVLTFFYLCWALLNVAGGTVTDGRPEVPYGVIWQYSSRTYLVNEPVKELESKRGPDEPRRFVRDKAAGPYVYKIEGGTERWSPGGVEWVKITHDNQPYTFKQQKQERGANPVFTDDETGWEMKTIEMGMPSKSSFGRLVVYFFLNAIHLVLWVACLWLLLRFSLPHAAGLGFVMWLLFTLVVFPGLFSRAAAALT